MNTDYTLPPDSTIITVDAYDRRLDTYFAKGVTIGTYGINRKNEKADLEK